MHPSSFIKPRIPLKTFLQAGQLSPWNESDELGGF